MALSEPVALPQEDKIETPEVSEKFELATSVTELYGTDFRVRTKIRENFETRAYDTRSNPYDHQNDAFQLALCYTLGFGTPMDREKASSYLRASMQSQEMLDKEINRAKCCAGSVNYNSEKLQDLITERVVRSSSFIDQYRQQRALAEAEIVCRREVADLCYAIGTSNYLTSLVKQQMARIASDMGRWSEAEDFLMQAMQSVCGLDLETAHLRSMMIYLADIYYQQARYREAEELLSDILVNQSKHLPAEHLERLEMLGSLAAVYMEQGKLHLAEEWFAELVKIQSKLLGTDHVVTLENMGKLAMALQTQGKWNEAEELRRRQFDILSKNFGVKHTRTQDSLANLATRFQAQGPWQEAKAVAAQVLNTSIATYGSNHPRTLTRCSNLAGILSDQGLWQEAEKLYLQCIEADRKDLGLDGLGPMIWSGNLASVYHEQGRYQDAEKLERSIVDRREAILGRSPERHFQSSSNVLCAGQIH